MATKKTRLSLAGFGKDHWTTTSELVLKDREVGVDLYRTKKGAWFGVVSGPIGPRGVGKLRIVVYEDSHAMKILGDNNREDLIRKYFQVYEE